MSDKECGNDQDCVTKVIMKIEAREAAGRIKYGVGMERTDLTHVDWLNHAQEEALDLAVYLQKLICASEDTTEIERKEKTI